MRVLALGLVVLVVGAAAASAKTVVGTNGPDRLVGTARADTLSGRGGADVLAGGAGNDLLVGGAGRDRIDAGTGSDLVATEYDGARDSVVCGRGVDTVTADPVDRVAADCELVARRISRDSYTNPESQHESEVEPDSFTFGSTTVAVFQVGRRFDGGATNIGFALSADDGRTWRSGLLPGLTTASTPAGPSERASDPVVAYDAAHGVWLASTLALGGGATRLAINRSRDGSSWEPALAAAAEPGESGEDVGFDKNWIACDNGRTSPFFGRCYLAYTHSADEDMLAVTTSNDGGVTWSAPVDVGVGPAVGVLPLVRPSGELVLAYLWETQAFAMAASRSLDGGASFEPPVRIAGISSSSDCSIPGFRAFPLPSGDVDAAGRVWLTWQDCPTGRAPTAVFLSSSADGVSWAPPARVTGGSSSTFLSDVALDPASGRRAIVYHRSLPTGMVVELVESTAAGGWTAPRRLSAVPMPLTWMPRTVSGRMLGDYVSVHYAAGRPLAVWVLASQPVDGELRQAVYATRG